MRCRNEMRSIENFRWTRGLHWEAAQKKNSTCHSLVSVSPFLIMRRKRRKARKKTLGPPPDDVILSVCRRRLRAAVPLTLTSLLEIWMRGSGPLETFRSRAQVPRGPGSRRVLPARRADPVAVAISAPSPLAGRDGGSCLGSCRLYPTSFYSTASPLLVLNTFLARAEERRRDLRFLDPA